MVSMKEIATLCGVSVATVSKALNDHKDIGADTKLRIRKVAEEAGYHPNAAARTLKTNRSASIGVLFTDEAHSGLTHDYFSAVLEAFKKEAEAAGYDITFINTNVGSGMMSYVERCRYRNLDGVVIACIDFDQPEAVELMNSSIPTVTIDYVTNNCTSVTSDNMRGMQELVEYVVGMGHRRIAYIHGEAASAVTKARLTSFYRTMDRFGINVPGEYIKTASYLCLEDSARLTEELMQLRIPPTCILYPDDTALIGGLNYIREHQLRIPEDISIAGYDGLRMAGLLSPKITTIRQDTDGIGRSAATQLIRMIEKPKTTPVERIVVEGTVIAGESVGKLPMRR